MTIAEAIKLRALIEKAAESLSDEQALTGIALFPHYEVGHAYAVGDRFQYEDKLFRVEQAHTSQADWIPTAVPALYTEIAPPEVIPVWRQPTGSQDAYRLGDKVHYPTANDPVYESTMDYNVYAPDIYGWQLVE